MTRPGRWLALAGAAAAYAVLRRLAPFRAAVEGDSMAPGLRRGDYLLAVRPGSIARGEVVVARRRGSLEVVKRVVGLPGERVRVEDGRVWVDGRELTEPHARGTGPPGEWLLGPGQYLLLGDQRDRSTDGRSFGPVSADEIVGVVRLRYWPRPGRVR